MDALTYKTAELKAILIANREAHRELFEKALAGWKAQALNRVMELSDDLHAGKMPDLVIGLPAPQDRTTDYDRVIKMLDMTVATEIDLDESDFAQYVMDDWGWKQQWTMSNAGYMR